MTKYFILMSIFAFLSVISFFNINAAWTEAKGRSYKKWNTILIFVGVALALTAIYFLILVSKTSN